jgi:hypothetical protein
MRSLVFLASVLWVSVGLAGELLDQGSWPEVMPQPIGTVSFSGSTAVLAPSGVSTDGGSIAYVDLYGTAGRLDLVSTVLNDKERPATGVEVVFSAQPEDLGNGWTRFSFRGRNARLEVRRFKDDRGWYNGFGNGAGISLLLRDGQFPVMEGTKNPEDMPWLANSKFYDTGLNDISGFPLGYPAINVVGETLDPPFGDATGDGRIDINDFGTLKDGFGQPTTPYQNGDVTGNLTVDMTDFGILKQNFGWKQAAVPEPSAFALLLLGIGAFFLRLFTK